MGNICSISFSCDALFSRCLDCAVTKAAYIEKLEVNLVALETELRELTAARNDVMRSVTIAEQGRMERTDQVKVWLSSVEAVEAEVAQLQQLRSQEIEKLCFGGYCSSNCKSSYQFGKRVANTLQEVKDLKFKGDFQEVAQQIPEDPVDEIPMDPIIIGQQSIFNEVWSCLKQKQIGIVGLYGPGGVGKTTLLKQINNSFCNGGHHFDVVIWTVVSKEKNLGNIQDDIGKKIGLSGESWSSKSPKDKARDIFKILNKKKFVLLLDDIWERVDLIELGVPPPNQKIESKVVFTTRFSNVCGQMEVDQKFEVKCLEHKEAWELFQNKVGSNILKSHPKIPMLAEIVAKECRGLPLALKTVGRAMACKSKLEEWEDALEVFRTSAFEFPGMESEVYSLLKFSYDNLPDQKNSQKIRSCFLYCSLFGEDCRINKRYLIECWLAEGFLGEYDGNRAINRGYTVIGDLVRACLLEEGDDYVVMHDVVRDMALWIACEIEKEKEDFLVQAGVGINKAPEIGKWEGVKRISLMNNKIESLSDIPHCFKLQTLFLGSNRLSIINGNFFQFMPCLKVLNLSYNVLLEELPSGISNLVSLEQLDISWTGLRKLPKEMKELVHLKYLSVETVPYLCTFPRQILSSLLMLRTLMIERCGWYEKPTEDSILFDGGESLIEELLYLEDLNTLDRMVLRNARAIRKLSSSQKLQSCCVSLCLEGITDFQSLDILSLADMKQLRLLDMSCCDFRALEIDCTGQRQFHGFESLESVMVRSCRELKDMTWLILAPNLKAIDIFDCIEMEEIINVEKLVKIQSMLGNDVILLGKLEFLKLEYLPKLKSIFWSALPFPHLKEIYVNGCPELKKLPLDSNRTIERKIVIKGEENWWKGLQWEDEATQNQFGSCFKRTR